MFFNAWIIFKKLQHCNRSDVKSKCYEVIQIKNYTMYINNIMYNITTAQLYHNSTK